MSPPGSNAATCLPTNPANISASRIKLKDYAMIDCHATTWLTTQPRTQWLSRCAHLSGGFGGHSVRCFTHHRRPLEISGRPDILVFCNLCCGRHSECIPYRMAAHVAGTSAYLGSRVWLTDISLLTHETVVDHDLCNSLNGQQQHKQLV